MKTGIGTLHVYLYDMNWAISTLKYVEQSFMTVVMWNWCERILKKMGVESSCSTVRVLRINMFVFTGLRPWVVHLIWRNDIITAWSKNGITWECDDIELLMVRGQTSAASQAAPSHPDKQTHWFLLCCFRDEGFGFKEPLLSLNRAAHLVRCVNKMTYSWVVPKAICLILPMTQSTNQFHYHPLLRTVVFSVFFAF